MEHETESDVSCVNCLHAAHGLVISAADSGTIRLWGRLKLSSSDSSILLGKHHDEAWSALIHGPDCFISGSKDGVIKVWSRAGNTATISNPSCGMNNSRPTGVSSILTIPLNKHGGYLLLAASYDRTIAAWASPDSISPDGFVIRTGHESMVAAEDAGSIDTAWKLPSEALNLENSLETLKDRMEPRYQRIKLLKGHLGAVQVLAKLPFYRIASGSDDTTIRLWDVRPGSTGEALSVLCGHRGQLSSLSSNILPSCKDGTWTGKRCVLLSGDAFGIVRVWDLETVLVIDGAGEETSIQAGAALSSPTEKDLEDSDTEDLDLCEDRIVAHTQADTLKGVSHCIQRHSKEVWVALWLKTRIFPEEDLGGNQSLSAFHVFTTSDYNRGSQLPSRYFMGLLKGKGPKNTESRLHPEPQLPAEVSRIDKHMRHRYMPTVWNFHLQETADSPITTVSEGHVHYQHKVPVLDVRSGCVLEDGSMATGHEDGTIRIWR